MRARALHALALVSLVLALPVRGDSTLGMIERFGPDGLPFTSDDPLEVGAYSSSVRFGSLAGDACAEENASWPGDIVSAHGHPGGLHPNVAETLTEGLTGNHRSRPDPNSFDPSQFVLDAPYDTTVWITGTNLENGQVGRFRVFPAMVPDPAKWIDEIDEKDSGRGWVDGWGADDEDMDQVVSAGVKNLHLSTLGLAIRDVKQAFGFSTAVKNSTIEYFPDFKNKVEGKIDHIDMFSQEAYVEAWVSEIQNLDTSEGGISGRFVIDLAGLQINAKMGEFETSDFPCSAHLDPYYLDLGGPVNSPAMGYDLISEYFIAEKWDDIWDDVRLDALGFIPGGCDFFKGIAKPIATDELKDKLEPLDYVCLLVDDDEYEVIGLYSGLAGKDGKNPYDRVALGVLKEFGQFRPAQWQRWKHTDEAKMLIGFKPPASFSITTSEEAMLARDTAGVKWRYNSGSSYIDKSMMIMGNSGGRDHNGAGLRLGDTDADHNIAVDDSADVLRTFAMQWLYVRLDAIDPYMLPGSNRAAEWQEGDILVPKDLNDPMPIDWPPPNYGFGRAQVTSFRAASGGTPQKVPDSEVPGGYVASVKPETALVWKGLISIDPVTRTYSVAGALYRFPEGSTIPQVWAIGEGAGGPWGVDTVLTWSEPRSLGDPLPSYLQNNSSRRWLTAAANRNREEWSSELRWGWDFDIESGGGSLDSFHAQHMSDVGGASWGGAFAYQTRAKLDPTGTARDTGRTGFAMVDQTTDF